MTVSERHLFSESMRISWTQILRFAIVCWCYDFWDDVNRLRGEVGTASPSFRVEPLHFPASHGGGVWVRSLSKSTNRWNIFLLCISVRVELWDIFLLDLTSACSSLLELMFGWGKLPWISLCHFTAGKSRLKTSVHSPHHLTRCNVTTKAPRQNEVAWKTWKLSISDDGLPWDERYIYLWNKNKPTIRV